MSTFFSNRLTIKELLVPTFSNRLTIKELLMPTFSNRLTIKELLMPTFFFTATKQNTLHFAPFIHKNVEAFSHSLILLFTRPRS